MTSKTDVNVNVPAADPRLQDKSSNRTDRPNPKKWFKKPDAYKPLGEIIAQGFKIKTRKRRRGAQDSRAKKFLRSTGGFFSGLFLVSVYTAIIIFVKSYNIWYCLVTSIILATFVSLGMGFSIKVRSAILLMLPQFFSNEGRTFILLAIFTLAVEGPLINILENFSRCAGTVSCGAELALNQTADLMQRAKEPLLSALEKIKKMAKKAKVVADHAGKFFKSIYDAIKHIGRALQNVWYWLTQMGQVCNRELGGPYRKCVKVFQDAKDNCMKAIPFLFFLCYIVDIFKPLCGLAKIILFFCIIPSYVGDFLRARVVDRKCSPFNDQIQRPDPAGKCRGPDDPQMQVPEKISERAPMPMQGTGEAVIRMLKKIGKEFEFNITSQHKFEIHFNSSKSLSQVAFDIMEDIEMQLAPFREFLAMFGYFATFIIIYMYLQALWYRKKYLLEDNFDNIYITRRFVEIDVMRAKMGKATVLPLQGSESNKYIQPCSLFMSLSELKGYTFAITNVFRHFLLIVFLILMDYVIFWILDMIRYLLHGEIIARAPVTVSVAINGTGYSSEIYSNVVSAFDALQRENISVVSKKCQLNPSEPDYNGYLIIGLMYGLAFFITIFGTYITRLQRVICASYYPSREQERIIFLYNNIITKRTSMTTALMKAIRRNSEDEGHTNIILILATKFPFFRGIANYFGIHEQFCMACGKIYEKSMTETFVSCITPGCKGLYCRQCYQHLGNICAICMAPLTYDDNPQDEVDSSDEEKIRLWIGAMKAMRVEEMDKRKRLRTLLKTRVKEAVRRKSASWKLPAEHLEKAGGLSEEGRAASEEESPRSGSETSESTESEDR
uniref:DC-STAMP domain-containing protein 2 n=1 Tax=Geotrypetes seraphini TaxID=260995 RepID=A0A6P8PDT0_GEOSA|nr:DC-STAMP domain-containing protein 2 [Geotrypetes seraphini]